MSDGAALQVVAGVLRDAHGRVLLAQRMPPRDWAGRWEFPGGKRESGEDSHAALARELDEELGIRIGPGTPLIRVPCAQGARPIVLEVLQVPHWQGTPHAREGQALQWLAPEQIVRTALPPADWPVVLALRLPPLLRITPADTTLGDLPRLLAVLQGDDALLRLRLPDPALARTLASALIAALPTARARILLGGDIAGAQALGCGVQLQAAQLAQLQQRPLPPTAWCLASCHDAGDLARSAALDCDAAVLGPVQPTATHPRAPALGWAEWRTLRAALPLPVYAIGGLAPADLAQARTQGAQGVAGIRAFWA